MNLKSSARKIAVTTVVGAVVVIGGSAFAEELMPSDPILVEVPVDDSPLVVEETVAEEPLAEEPLAEEPLAEEPLAEEPLAEEPLADEPVLDDAPDGDDTEEVIEEAAPAVEAHPDNHGAAVSEAAHAPTPEGARNHGEAVSEVARSNAGKPEGRGQGHGRGHDADDTEDDTEDAADDE